MKKLIALFATAMLVACQEAPSGYHPEPFTFVGKPPLRLDVAQINVIENYQSPLALPNVEQDFPVPPAKAVREWANKRLVAVGTSGVMEVIIDDASVKETKLPKTKGVKGLFTDDQDARYDASLHVTMRVFTGQQALSDATGDVQITRSRSINEKATADERSKIFHTMTRDMITSFDEQAESRLRTYFGRFLR